MRATASGSVTAETNNSSVPKRTPLILIWAFLTLIWSIFTPPHRTFAARALLFQPTWALRVLQQDSTWTQDLALSLSLHAIYSYVTGAWRLPSSNALKWIDWNDRTIQIYLQVFPLLAMCGLFAGGIVFREEQLRSKSREPPELSHDQRIDDQVLPPLLLASKTTHSRLFPRKHTFVYSYLLVGVPVGIKGRISKLLSVDTPRHGWFSVESADFLDRGSGSCLAEKLKKYLHTQGVTDRDYAFAYLVTAPRFLGYSFNPVSFWYLYDSDTKLKYMILEVNNTFGERRLYLLRGNRANNDSGIDLSQDAEGMDDSDAGQLLFTETWEKDFHVSPFNSRKGSYSLRATDPLAAFEQTGQVRVDNTIVLRSSKEHPKVVARVYSEGEPKDPAQISTQEAISFVLRWCWVGFATFPRIVWEAAKLSIKRKLHVWYRPEVAASSIGRAYTEDEKLLEAFFRAFLTNTVSEASKPIRVVYEPAHSENTEVVLYSPDFTYEEDHNRTLTVKVLSPAFYSRFVHYEHADEAFEQECLAAEEKNRTAHIERPELLPVLLAAIGEQRASAQRPCERQSTVEQIRWACLRRLRCPPAAASYPTDSSRLDAEYNLNDIRPSGDSELDCFVKEHCEDSDVYRRIVTKLFLAERVALGLPALLVALDWIFRSVLLLASIIYSSNCEAGDVLRPSKLHVGDTGNALAMLLLANAVHIWNLLKG
ncbi:hypothetical protein LTR85_006058 [Meristemomyces frigidus]|nr:hypothetical protein LTR85_006058 [Meristemomyces frigidus]